MKEMGSTEGLSTPQMQEITHDIDKMAMEVQRQG
jgi:hypothetical protein